MKTIEEANLNNKNVIIRCDFNVPIKDNKILDITRIKKSIKTINYVLERANKVILLSHLSRIKTEEDKKNKSLKIIIPILSELLNQKVAFCDYTNTKEIINNNKIILMENTRFFDLDNNKESNCDLNLSKYFSSFGDIFIDDAFAVSHRTNASNVGITKFLPSYNGFLFIEEINNLNKLLDNPKRPFTILLGGKKVSDKLPLIFNLIDKVDKILIGGAMSYTFLKAIGKNIGNSFSEDKYLDESKNIYNKYKDKIILIEDNYNQDNILKDINDMNNNDIGKDIGPKTIDIFKKELEKSNTIFVNGPQGLYEKGYDYGTKETIKILEKLDSTIVVGGGDTVSSVNRYSKNNNFIISTGGGATLEYLAGKKLPGIIEDENEEV